MSKYKVTVTFRTGEVRVREFDNEAKADGSYRYWANRYHHKNPVLDVKVRRG
jgi:hypothetical protein